MDFTFDTETIPPQRPDVFAEILAEEQRTAELEAASIEPPGNYKSPETIAKWWSETGTPRRNSIMATVEAAADEKYRKLALDGAYGQLAVLGYAIDDRDPVAIYRKDDWATSEAEIIRTLYSVVLEAASKAHNQIRFIGHNIIGFDLRYLFQRSVINGIRPPAFIPFNTKPWEQDKVLDTMIAWAGVGRTISLDNLCKALGIPSPKGAIDGSKVWDYVKDGRIDEVADYCANGDVAQTRACAQRLTFATDKFDYRAAA